MPDAPQLAQLASLRERLAVLDDALALLGLGSIGRSLDRFDEHSDLDYFVVVRTGAKQRFLNDLGWLGEPLLWLHRNTDDGYKALVADVFHEFAVFEPSELPTIQFEPGRVVWARLGFDTAILEPTQRPPTPDAGWLVNEILSNLFVGMHRFLRGERLAGAELVQGEAVTRLLQLLGTDDAFVSTRRAEQRIDPALLASWTPGYAATPAAADSILRELEANATVNSEMARSIRELIQR